MPSLIDNKVLGIQGKLLVGAAGSTPTVVLADDTECNLNINNAMAKYSTRGQPRANARVTTQELAMDFTVVKDFSNASYVLLHAAAMGRTPIAIKSLDKTSGYGWDGDWVVSEKQGQPLEGWTTSQFECEFTSDYRALTEINPS